ncbi:transposase [Sinorhizobium americanum CCGM7]|nr:transposase [Sinorhizobium americanum CCGM7]
MSGLRAVVGTDLVGARGATAADQHRIDRSVVGLCAASVWTKSECMRHGELRDG